MSITVPFYALRDAPKMSEASYQKLLQRNRARYAADPEPENPDPLPSTDEKTEKPPAPPNASTKDPPRQSQPKRPRRDPDA